MNQIIKKELRIYRPAIMVEKVFPRSVRRFIQAILFISSVALFTYIVSVIVNNIINNDIFNIEYVIGLLLNDVRFAFGLLLLSFSILFFVSMLSFYFNSRFFRGIESITHEFKSKDKRGISYEVAQIILNAKGDLTSAFILSDYGMEILLRCNVSVDSIKDFLNGRREGIPAGDIPLPKEGFLTIDGISTYCYTTDQYFSKFLFDNGVTEDVYNGATAWVMLTYHYRKHNTRWWSKDNLGKVVPIGSGWSYGGAYLLERFAKDIRNVAIFSLLSNNVAYAKEKVEQIETVLAKAKEANVILVGERGVGKMDVIVQLAQKIKAGKAVPAIANKRIVVFDFEGFVVAHDNKESFEVGIVRLFKEATNAGNIIIAIDNFPSFLSSAEALGSNVFSLIDLYITGTGLQLLATSDPSRFHDEIESKPEILQRFERVQIESPELSSTIRVLESIAARYERKYNVLFTYPSIQAIVETADRYITDGVMPDKAVELLTEIAPYANQKKVSTIISDFVYEFVGTKTGIKAGPIKENERDKLLNLERELHKRVIGQDNALTAISSVMRRSRAGIQNATRPLGSFLFLGSTGVGKTETAKALSSVFFGGEDRMSRLDMSEFSDENSLERLTGSGNKTGILSALLKEKPYGVLLLDEFEKSSTEVHDLFLQILDEGVFSDNHGARISARNSIIIATSNAGSSLIWDIVKNGGSPVGEREKIINSIIKDGVYKPELINRFDGTIIFEPLNKEQQRLIAKLMLQNLQKRMEKKGYDLVVDEYLIDVLLKDGYSPEFGARPMRRVIQDLMEEKIAEKIIAGNLKKGDKIWFKEEDFQTNS